MKKCKSLRKDWRDQWFCGSSHVCYKLVCLDPERDVFLCPVAHIGSTVSEYSSMDEVNQVFNKRLHTL